MAEITLESILRDVEEIRRGEIRTTPGDDALPSPTTEVRRLEFASRPSLILSYGLNDPY